MIAKKFYSNPDNISKVFLGGKRNHFMPREATTVVNSYAYTIKGGEDVYSLAIKVFGEEQQNNWFMIADSNHLRPIDEWESGDTINLPELIVLESDTNSNRKTMSLGRFNTALFR